MNFRNNYARLAEALYQKGDSARALNVVNKCIKEFSNNVARYSYFSIPIIDVYYRVGEFEKGNEILAIMIEDYMTELNYLKNFKSNSGLSQNKNICTQVIANLNRLVEIYALSDPTYNYSQNENGLFLEKKMIKRKRSAFPHIE